MPYRGKHLKGSMKPRPKRKGKIGEAVMTVKRPPKVDDIIAEVKSWKD